MLIELFGQKLFNNVNESDYFRMELIEVFKYFYYNQNWNIGFSIDTPKSLLENGKLGRVRWMKHKYRDRIFADPFVLDTSKQHLFVLAEEMKIKTGVGRIVLLTIDKLNFKLVKKECLLQLDTHLSFPAIIKIDEETFVYPENSETGCLNIYNFERGSKKLYNKSSLVNEPLLDAIIIKKKSKYFLIATKKNDNHSTLRIYVSDSLSQPFNLNFVQDFDNKKFQVRGAGNIFYHNRKYYRPSQDCQKRYGAAIIINEIVSISEECYNEEQLFSICPNSFKYNLGVHTINFYEDGCVIDGVGYLFPIIGRVIYNISRFRREIIKNMTIG
jgi:hypothetical protein